ncbi:hypothetical protein, partial [Actinomadura sp. SCN-SB]|uniref:hypothetical protein n=1 Tax=Actinomadura sp. SCN-SB TaxID=3373092 RepID=UPI0037536B2F
VAPSPPKPRLFSWDVPDRRTGGVTDDLDRAHQHVMDALWESDPGTEGQVRRVTLATTAPSTYTDCGMVAHARRLLRDVVWDPA